MAENLSAELGDLIHFFEENGGQLPPLSEQRRLRSWIASVCESEHAVLEELNYIFCGDAHLLEINRQYLQHDYYTDIITFPAAEAPRVAGDIFISTERVTENARTYACTYEEELRRVIIHGVLHLCGQGDKTEEEAQQMREKENQALQKVNW